MKILTCVHPLADASVGDTRTLSDAEANALLVTRTGPFNLKAWELCRDLGPDAPALAETLDLPKELTPDLPIEVPEEKLIPAIEEIQPELPNTTEELTAGSTIEVLPEGTTLEQPSRAEIPAKGPVAKAKGK